MKSRKKQPAWARSLSSAMGPVNKIVRLRLLASASQALQNLGDSELLRLPEAVLQFNVAAIESLDVQEPWLRFSFPNDANSAQAVPNKWNAHDAWALDTLHDMVSTDAISRGLKHVDIDWGRLSRDDQVLYAHMWLQLIDPWEMFLVVIDQDFLRTQPHGLRGGISSRH